MFRVLLSLVIFLLSVVGCVDSLLVRTRQLEAEAALLLSQIGGQGSIGYDAFRKLLDFALHLNERSFFLFFACLCVQSILLFGNTIAFLRKHSGIVRKA